MDGGRNLGNKEGKESKARRRGEQAKKVRMREEREEKEGEDIEERTLTLTLCYHCHCFLYHTVNGHLSKHDELVTLKEVRKVTTDFHARYSVIQKTYKYRIVANCQSMCMRFVSIYLHSFCSPFSLFPFPPFQHHPFLAESTFSPSTVRPFCSFFLSLSFFFLFSVSLTFLLFLSNFFLY